MEDTIRDQRFMTMALSLAREAFDAGEFPVGAVVVRGEQVIATARNEREATKDPTAHAEVLALRRAAAALGGWRLVDCEVYVTLEPCPMCAGAIYMARPARLVFGAYDENYGCCGSRLSLLGQEGFKPVVRVEGGVMAEESRQIMAAFGKWLRERS